MKNHKEFITFVIIVVLLGMAFLAYGARDLFTQVINQPIKVTVTIQIPQKAVAKTVPHKTPQNDSGLSNPVAGTNGRAEVFTAQQPKAEPVGQPTKIVQLLRVDYSGDYLLPNDYTFRQVIEVYMDGQPVNRDRVAVLPPGDSIDINDAKLDSKITALIQY